MTKLIAETAWHHEGDFLFMKDLVTKICKESAADIVKMHITLNLDEYMSPDHDSYKMLKEWMFTAEQWSELISIVKKSNKELMLLLNDTVAIEFACSHKPDFIEVHSVCLNVPRLQKAIIAKIDRDTPIIIGVGGCSLQEIDLAISSYQNRKIILMFGFQNYPTKYEDVNLNKVRKIQSLYADMGFGYADHTGWDEVNNEIITLLISSNGMNFIEKHVTTLYGQKRCDYSAAISIDKFNQLAKKIKLIDQLYGDGLIGLNLGEKSYSQYGPMKMAALVKHNIEAGTVLLEEDFSFMRTAQQTKMSQLDVLSVVGVELKKSVNAGQVLDWVYFD